ncbi:methionyl-tRNA formyltransferase [Pseudomonas sp. Marseille-Q8238]
MLTLLTTLEFDAPLFSAVESSGLVSKVVRSREGLGSVSDANVLLINWPYILSSEFISRQHAVLNVHNSLLPRYRGRHAFTWAILNGETQLGFSLHEVVAEVDAGGVLAQVAFNLGVDEDINDAFRRGTALLNEWLPSALIEWASGRLVAHPQDETCASLFRRRHAQDNWLVSFDRAEKVRDFVRAVAPPYTQGAMCCTAAGEILHFSSSEVVDDAASSAAPGCILKVDEESLLVACVHGVVRLVPVESGLLAGLHAGDSLVVAEF